MYNTTDHSIMISYYQKGCQCYYTDYQCIHPSIQHIIDQLFLYSLFCILLSLVFFCECISCISCIIHRLPGSADLFFGLHSRSYEYLLCLFLYHDIHGLKNERMKVFLCYISNSNSCSKYI